MSSPSASTSTISGGLSPELSARLRLDALSYLLSGSNAHPSAENADGVLARLSALISQLNTLTTTDRPLNRLLGDWNTYAPLLHPSSSLPDAQHRWDADEQRNYLLTQHAELTESTSALTKVQALVEEQSVLDPQRSRSLARTLDKQKPRLAAAKEYHAQQAASAAERQERLLRLVQDWSHYTSTLSQTFTLLDAQILALERNVAALERTHT